MQSTITQDIASTELSAVGVEGNDIIIDERFRIPNKKGFFDKYIVKYPGKFTAIGEDTKIDQKVVVKIFPEKDLAQFEAEMKRLDSLTGNVTHIKYANKMTYEGEIFYCFIMPFHGVGLRDLLPTVEQTPSSLQIEYEAIPAPDKLKYLLKILKPIALILDNFKNKNEYYVDLKPANILVNDIVSGDFKAEYPLSIARLIDIDDLYPEGEWRKGITYTERYAPPEFTPSHYIIHPTIHTYTFAKTLQDALGSSFFAFRDSKVSEVFQKATDENPEKRFQSCIELFEALEAAISELE